RRAHGARGGDDVRGGNLLSGDRRRLRRADRGGGHRNAERGPDHHALPGRGAAHRESLLALPRGTGNGSPGEAPAAARTERATGAVPMAGADYDASARLSSGSRAAGTGRGPAPAAPVVARTAAPGAATVKSAVNRSSAAFGIARSHSSISSSIAAFHAASARFSHSPGSST